MTRRERLPAGDHAALICTRPTTWRQVVFPFLAEGIRQGEKSVYLTTLHTPKAIMSLLAQEGVDVDQALARGSFRVLDAARSYMPQGWFDPDATIASYIRATESAMEAGFAGLRAVGDMAWACYQASAWDRLEDYERRVGAELIEPYPLKAICFYDRALFERSLVSTMEVIHPTLWDECSVERRDMDRARGALGGSLRPTRA